MGSGSSKTRGTPTILKATRREPTTINLKEDRKENTAVVETSTPEVNKAPDTQPVVPKVIQESTDDKAFVKTVYGACNSKWPIRCICKLDINVNSHHGGGAALYSVSCAYGGEGTNTTAELFLVRNGFDGNHVQLKSITKDHEGHFGAANGAYTDEDGMFVGECLFGSNHLMFLSNENCNGNLRNGIYVETASTNTDVALPINVNGAKPKHGGGLTLLLCSTLDSGTMVSAVYMIRLGHKDNKYRAKHITGEDKYQFSVDRDGNLTVTGPQGGSKYGVFHNRENVTSQPAHAYVGQIQSLNGKKREVLLDNLSKHAALLLLCSNSNGFEDSTAAAVYSIVICEGKLVTSNHISGCHGKSYETSDLWKFSVGSGQVIVEGPDGPCKYGILSNMRADKTELLSSVKQGYCLGTGEDTKTTGKVKVTLDGVSGEINKSTDICIMMNHMIVTTIPASDLQRSGNVFKFTSSWKPEEKVVGYHIVRVFAIRKHTETGKDIQIEIDGSPFALTRQKPGVVYALNCAGPAYQALNDVVYSSEFHQFANYSYDNCFGSRSMALGKQKYTVKLPAMMLNSQDGFLHVSCRSPQTEAIDEQKVIYKVDDIPNGKYTFRLHLVNKPENMQLNDNEISKELRKQIDAAKKPRITSETTCFVVDLDFTVKNNSIKLQTRAIDNNRHGEMIAGFALLDSTYKDKVISPAERQEQEEEKSRLSNQIAPLSTTVTKKKMTIVGWSPNLLQNASGADESMRHWNTSGDIKVMEGGHGTDKSFVTGHMWSEKYQEVNLLDHFTAEYLDTAPDIQVREMYMQGVCGGGFYCFTVQLMDENGEVIDEYSTGELGRLYSDPWLEAAHTFTNYRPGVRIVSFSSRGKDDKFWAGFYGARMSAAEVRVKRETKPAQGDVYEDLQIEESESKEVDNLVTNLLIDNQQLLQNSLQEEAEIVQDSKQQTRGAKKSTITKRKLKKKREIRVFVSSTFRDFTKEREEIIKKAFREVNRFCVDRGVFFTYVDLRWGITSEQTSDGKTISICLQEIDRCRPYFICLLGNRFGWCQREDKPDEVLNMTYDYAIENVPNLKWIQDCRFDTSVTQLEIFHGVLNNVDASKDRAFFYLRDPPIREELSDDDYKRRCAESDWHMQQVTNLKSKITSNKELHVAQFKTADQVASMIREDLTNSIDTDFPIGTQLTKLEQQREAHDAFASVRCRVYIGREEYFTEINTNKQKHINKPFVLLGESGSGKSALVANWCKRVEDAEPDSFIFVHFIGSSSDSADYMKLLRRLFEEMKFFYNFDMQIPSSDTLLINELPKWLRIAGSRSKVIIVMDALNQLDDGSGKDGAEHDLLWIPSELPPNVFMLLSTLPGRTLKAVESFGWPHMIVRPLQDEDKLQIITDYLEGIYGKTLNQEQKDMIVNAGQTSNPLFLKSLLDEVRMYGSFRTLTDKISEYLTATMPSELFAKILERLESDFEQGPNSRKSLVHDATTALWCSNKGMSEAELVELLDVPSAIWSPFYLSLFESLVNRDGLLNFFHDHLRQAVENKYLPTDEAKKKGYLNLANFFSEKETSERTVEELPFLLTKAGELDRLKVYVSDLDVFQRLNKSEDGYFELVKAWKTLGGFSLAEEAYMSEVNKLSMEVVMADYEYYCQVYSKLGDFFRNLGLIESAKTVYMTLIKQLELNYGDSHGTIVYSAFNQTRRYQCKHPDVIKNLQNLGQVYVQLGQFDQAVSVYKDAIGRQNRIETPSQALQLCEGLMGLATAYIQQENMVEADKLMIRALELATSVLGKKHHFVASIYTKLGQLSYKQGRLEEALLYYLQDLRVTRSEFGTSHPAVSTVLNEIALVYDDKNDTLAVKLYEAALSIILETFGKNYLGTGIIRYNLGAFYFGTNYFAKAKFQFEESYKIHVNFLGEDHVDTKVVKEAMDEVKSMTG